MSQEREFNFEDKDGYTGKCRCGEFAHYLDTTTGNEFECPECGVIFRIEPKVTVVNDFFEKGDIITDGSEEIKVLGKVKLEGDWYYELHTPYNNYIKKEDAHEHYETVQENGGDKE